LLFSEKKLIFAPEFQKMRPRIAYFHIILSFVLMLLGTNFPHHHHGSVLCTEVHHCDDTQDCDLVFHEHNDHSDHHDNSPDCLAHKLYQQPQSISLASFFGAEGNFHTIGLPASQLCILTELKLTAILFAHPASGRPVPRHASPKSLRAPPVFV